MRPIVKITSVKPILCDGGWTPSIVVKVETGDGVSAMANARKGILPEPSQDVSMIWSYFSKAIYSASAASTGCIFQL